MYPSLPAARARTGPARRGEGRAGARVGSAGAATSSRYPWWRACACGTRSRACRASPPRTPPCQPPRSREKNNTLTSHTPFCSDPFHITSHHITHFFFFFFLKSPEASHSRLIIQLVCWFVAILFATTVVKKQPRRITFRVPRTKPPPSSFWSASGEWECKKINMKRCECALVWEEDPDFLTIQLAEREVATTEAARGSSTSSASSPK